VVYDARVDLLGRGNICTLLEVGGINVAAGLPDPAALGTLACFRIQFPIASVCCVNDAQEALIGHLQSRTKRRNAPVPKMVRATITDTEHGCVASGGCGRNR
jgi:hypothetical protein